MLRRPTAKEYDPFYETYVDKAPENDILAALAASLDETLDLVASIPEERRTWAYAEGKWSVADVLAHMADAERTFGYRAFAIARGDEGDLNGMDQEVYARHARADRLSLAHLGHDFELARRANLHLFSGLTDKDWARRGRASGSPFTARVFPWILLGHERHHRSVLRERYLG